MFITLINDKDNKPITINTDFIEYISDYYVNSNTHLWKVKETREEILEKINKASDKQLLKG